MSRPAPAPAFLLGSVPLLACCWSAAAGVEVFFQDNFDALWEQRWVHSTWHGENGLAGRFEWSAGEWYVNESAQKGLRTASDMHYHSISARLPQPFSSRGRDLVVQFSVKHESQDFTFCAGGYVKLLPSSFDQATFGGETPYRLMFGPDICSYDVARIHVGLSWRGANLLRDTEIPLRYEDKDGYTHLYTLVVRPDNSYAVFLDLKERASGSLHDHWSFPNKTIDDAADRKPEDWVEAQRIDDPTERKPADWVDQPRIRDPEAARPAEWDEEEDGTWEAPIIDNPKYVGAWIPMRVPNPAYKGEWAPRQLENPEYVEEVYAVDDVGGVGFELWTVHRGSVFDNVLICDSLDHAKAVGGKLLHLFAGERQARRAWAEANGKPFHDITALGRPEQDEDEEDLPRDEL